MAAALRYAATLGGSPAAMLTHTKELDDDMKDATTALVVRSSITKMEDDGLLPRGEDHHANPKNSSERLAPSAATPISWVRRCARVIFRRSPEKVVPRNLGRAFDLNVSPAEEVPEAVAEAQVGKKRPNCLVSCDESEVLEPKAKHPRNTIRNMKLFGFKISSECPSVIEDKCSNNEHDAAQVGNSSTCKGREYGSEVPLDLETPASSEDSTDDLSTAKSELSVEVKVSATEPSKGDALEVKEEDDEDSDDDEEEETSRAQKFWRFLIT